jgi:LytS/YehU family sensor histidine kinase
VKSVNKKNAQLIYQLNLENQLIESSITSIKAQMNPHFIFNALNTIQSFIYNNEKSNASNYLGKFSGLIRSILDFSQKSKIPLNEEINLIENYCFLESKRFNENELLVTIEIEKSIDIENIQIPPLLIQPYIENSFKHGLFHKEGQKTLLIHIKMEELSKKLIITIDDNGIGRVLSREINEKNPKQSGFGIKANEKRIELINKMQPGSVSICFSDKYDDNGNSLGTTVKIEILINT